MPGTPGALIHNPSPGANHTPHTDRRGPPKSAPTRDSVNTVRPRPTGSERSVLTRPLGRRVLDSAAPPRNTLGPHLDSLSSVMIADPRRRGSALESPRSRPDAARKLAIKTEGRGRRRLAPESLRSGCRGAHSEPLPNPARTPAARLDPLRRARWRQQLLGAAVP